LTQISLKNDMLCQVCRSENKFRAEFHTKLFYDFRSLLSVSA